MACLTARPGAELDPGSRQVWVDDLPVVLLSPAAQSRFVHLMGACYFFAATLTLSISAWYLLRRRNVQIAWRSPTLAAGFGVAAAPSLALLGDHRGYAAWPSQQMRIAAIVAEWRPQPAPAAVTRLGIPDGDGRVTRAAVNLPWVLGPGGAIPGPRKFPASTGSRR